MKSGLKENVREQLIHGPILHKPHLAVNAAGILDAVDDFDQVTNLAENCLLQCCVKILQAVK